MNSLLDEITEAAADVAIFTLLLWIVAGAVFLVAAALWYLLLGVVWCLLVIWHGSAELIRYFFRRAET